MCPWENHVTPLMSTVTSVKRVSDASHSVSGVIERDVGV